MSHQSEAVALLRPIRFFASFDDAWLESVYGLASYREAKAGTYLVKESEEGQEMFILLAGELAVEVSLPRGRGKEVVATLGQGELLGELTLLGYTRRSASARVVTDVSTLSWQRDELLHLFAEHTDIGFAFMTSLARVLAGKLISTNADLSAAFFHAVYK